MRPRAKANHRVVRSAGERGGPNQRGNSAGPSATESTQSEPGNEGATTITIEPQYKTEPGNQAESRREAALSD